MRRFAWFLFGAIALFVAIVIAGGVVLTGAHGSAPVSTRALWNAG